MVKTAWGHTGNSELVAIYREREEKKNKVQSVLFNVLTPNLSS